MLAARAPQAKIEFPVLPVLVCVCGGGGVKVLTTFSSYDKLQCDTRKILRNHAIHELLFGKDTSTDEENEALFLKVQDYILKSKGVVH